MMNDGNGFDPSYFPPNPASVQPINPNLMMSETIASMRWETDPLLVMLRVRLGGYVAKATSDGRTILEREQGVNPMVNDLGIDRFVAIIHGVVNPVVALSNVDDDEANTLIRQLLYDVIFDMVYNKDRYQIHDGDMRTIMSVMKSIVFMQVKRPVAGHEAKNYRTQTIEQNLQSQVTMPQKQGSMLNPFSWGSRR